MFTIQSMFLTPLDYSICCLHSTAEHIQLLSAIEISDSNREKVPRDNNNNKKQQQQHKFKTTILSKWLFYVYNLQLAYVPSHIHCVFCTFFLFIDSVCWLQFFYSNGVYYLLTMLSCGLSYNYSAEHEHPTYSATL